MLCFLPLGLGRESAEASLNRKDRIVVQADEQALLLRHAPILAAAHDCRMYC